MIVLSVLLRKGKNYYGRVLLVRTNDQFEALEKATNYLKKSTKDKIIKIELIDTVLRADVVEVGFEEVP